MITLGTIVKPRPEWIGDPNNVPTGQVRALAMSGRAAYVGDEPRAFATYVFDVVEPDPEQTDMFAQIED